MKLVVYWPFIYVITIALYLLVVFSLPFSQVAATFFLFMLVSYWSRIPGVGFPTPLYFLYLADLVDFFALIVAINLGPIYGCIIVIFANIASRANGVFPRWQAVLKDTFALCIACFLIVPIHQTLGGDIFISMIIFNLIRILMFIPMRIVPGSSPFPQFIIEFVTVVPLSFIINGMYARFFGDFFDSLMKEGVKFNWILFAGVTAVILISMVYLKKITAKNTINPIRDLLKRSTQKKKKQTLHPATTSAAPTFEKVYK